MESHLAVAMGEEATSHCSGSPMTEVLRLLEIYLGMVWKRQATLQWYWGRDSVVVSECIGFYTVDGLQMAGHLTMIPGEDYTWQISVDLCLGDGLKKAGYSVMTKEGGLHGHCCGLPKLMFSNGLSCTQEMVFKCQVIWQWQWGERLCIVTSEVSPDKDLWVSKLYLGDGLSQSMFRSPKTEIFESVELHSEDSL